MLQAMSPVQLLTPNSAGMSPPGHLLRYAAVQDTPSTPLPQNGAALGSLKCTIALAVDASCLRNCVNNASHN